MESSQPNQPTVALNHNQVETVVQRAIQAEAAQVIEWQIDPLTGGREAVSRIYRVMVKVQLPTEQALIDLPLVLKIVRRTPERESPNHWNYWLREAEAYSAGVFSAGLPASLSAPQCYGVDVREDEVWLWLQFIDGMQETPWTEAEVRAVCFELGRFNGSYLTGAPLPTGRWATPAWLRQYWAVHVATIEQLPQLQEHWLVGNAVTPALLPRLLQVTEASKQWLDQLDRLPQVFCHQDIHRGNLFVTDRSDGSRQLIAIDWSFAGIAAVGQELAAVIFTNRRLPNIYQAVTQPYLAGLRAVGWTGDDVAVLWSSAVATAINYGVAMVGLFLGHLLDEQKHHLLVDGFGISIDQLPPRVNRWVEFGLHYADLAQEIAG